MTYIPMRRGFLYLVAIMDWATRKVLAWRLSNTMDAGFCVATLEEALARFGKPEIFNTDQGSQFTSYAFTSVLRHAEVRISMDGRGRWMDNVFIERLWRSLKYECVYLHAFETGSELRAGLGRWITYYNTQRPHSGLAGRTPVEAYRQIGRSDHGGHAPHDLMIKHTLFPFYTAYLSNEARAQVRTNMRRMTEFPVNNLRVGQIREFEPTHLRYCRDCCEEMMVSKGELWWRRIHQLPGVTVCAEHGSQLINSAVDLRVTNRQVFSTADQETCRPPSEPQLPVDASLVALQRKIAVLAARLLTSPPPPIGGEELYQKIVDLLRAKGLVSVSRFVGRREFARRPQVRAAIQAFWGPVLDVMPGLGINRGRGTDWVARFLLQDREGDHPLRHLVFNVAIEALPDVPAPFGDGPWPCRNVNAGHYGSDVVVNRTLRRSGNGVSGRFICECGFIYTQWRRTSGSC